MGKEVSLSLTDTLQTNVAVNQAEPPSREAIECSAHRRRSRTGYGLSAQSTTGADKATIAELAGFGLGIGGAP